MSAPIMQLPGIYFAQKIQQSVAELPPLDFAALVGFAERGPLHFPVALSDISMYRDIFGADLPVAKDEKGQTVYAHLQRCMSQFFSNGGRRCYAVRVAGNAAKPARLPIPGMITVTETGDIGLAALSSSSPGSWGNQLKLASRLIVTPLPAVQFKLLDTNSLSWTIGGAPQAIETGDILRIRISEQNYLFPVATVSAVSAEGTAVLESSRVWRLISSSIGISDPVGVYLLTSSGDIHIGAGQWRTAPEGIGLKLTGAGAENVQQGDVLRLELSGGGLYFFPVAGVMSLQSQGGVQAFSVEILDSGLPVLVQPIVSSAFSLIPQQVDRLRFDLLLRLGEEVRPVMAEMAFNEGHSRFFGEVVLLESSPRFRSTAMAKQNGNSYAGSASLFRLMQPKVGTPDSAPQYPRIDPVRDGTPDADMLAGLLAPTPSKYDTAADTPEKVVVSYLPLGMLTNASAFAGPSNSVDLGNDDLQYFDEHSTALFLDASLAGNPAMLTNPAALLAAAFDRYYSNDTRLLGLHSLIFIDEVALIGVPDAVHRYWSPANADQIPFGNSPPNSAAAVTGNFSKCLQPPVIRAIIPNGGPLSGDNLPVKVSGDGFIPGATTIKFKANPARDVQVTDSSQLSCSLPPGGGSGWVDVTVETVNGSFSLADGFYYQKSPSQPALPQMQSAQDFDFNSVLSPLLPIQQGLIQLCQARADMVGILSLPSHYEKRQCLEWQQSLRGRLGLPQPGIVPDGVQDIADLSYAAIYHPWLLLRDQNSAAGLMSTPPDGAVLGMIAARERDRQVWVAPANLPLRGVLGLTPIFSAADSTELFTLQFNLIGQEVNGFPAVSAHTLSDAQNLLQISVRRLLILLRKVALDKGMEFVFEDNTERFRSSIQVTLEKMLRFFFDKGAFAGLNQSQAFRIVTDSTINTVDSVAQGQLIVQIQIAPSQPLEFMTIFLVRSGSGLLQAAEG